jgi:2-dehydro-3-deoxyphosphogluconate aldolase / (4S)-4-hydroxy-2-oxoglutarate aldolase
MSVFNKSQVLEKLVAYPIVPVFFHKSESVTKSILECCYNGGIRAFEFTNRGAEAPTVFAEAAKFVRANFPDMALGIGTIFNAEQAKQFIELGAAFVVQPVTTKEVGDYCQSKSIAWAPGAGTANEVYNATLLGADIVKLFPGNVLGPGFVKSLKGPMPNVKLMVTGGVDPTTESLTSWFRSGVTSVGIGSQLFPQALLDKGNFKELSEQISGLMKVARELIAK